MDSSQAELSPLPFKESKILGQIITDERDCLDPREVDEDVFLPTFEKVVSAYAHGIISQNERELRLKQEFYIAVEYASEAVQPAAEYWQYLVAQSWNKIYLVRYSKIISNPFKTQAEMKALYEVEWLRGYRELDLIALGYTDANDFASIMALVPISDVGIDLRPAFAVGSSGDVYYKPQSWWMEEQRKEPTTDFRREMYVTPVVENPLVPVTGADDMRGFVKLEGYKAVQFNNWFLNIPQLVDVAFEATNLMWEDAPRYRMKAVWLVVNLNRILAYNQFPNAGIDISVLGGVLYLAYPIFTRTQYNEALPCTEEELAGIVQWGQLELKKFDSMVMGGTFPLLRVQAWDTLEPKLRRILLGLDWQGDIKERYNMFQQAGKRDVLAQSTFGEDVRVAQEKLGAGNVKVYEVLLDLWKRLFKKR